MQIVDKHQGANLKSKFCLSSVVFLCPLSCLRAMSCQVIFQCSALWPVVFYHVLSPFALSWDHERRDKFSKKEDDLDAAEN